MLDYDVSFYILVVVTIPTSPRSSKTESGSKSYARFGIGVPTVFHKFGSSDPTSGYGLQLLSKSGSTGKKSGSTAPVHFWA